MLPACICKPLLLLCLSSCSALPYSTIINRLLLSTVDGIEGFQFLKLSPSYPQLDWARHKEEEKIAFRESERARLASESHLLAIIMDRNQAWPGEPPSQLAATSTHELFGGGNAGGSSSGGAGHQQQQQQQQQQYSLQQHHLSSYQAPHPYQHEHQYASEIGAKKAARRNRNALSCAECRRLKLKCSRVWPCTVSWRCSLQVKAML